MLVKWKWKWKPNLSICLQARIVETRMWNRHRDCFGKFIFAQITWTHFILLCFRLRRLFLISNSRNDGIVWPACLSVCAQCAHCSLFNVGPSQRSRGTLASQSFRIRELLLEIFHSNMNVAVCPMRAMPDTSDCESIHSHSIGIPFHARRLWYFTFFLSPFFGDIFRRMGITACATCTQRNKRVSAEKYTRAKWKHIRHNCVDCHTLCVERRQTNRISR